jgi:YheO-like PAS domain
VTGHPAWLRPHAPVCEAIAALLAPHAEVAVHDLSTERIVALWNPISGRAVGDDSLIDELPGDPSSAPVIGPYPKVLPDGRGCASVSAVLTDESGRPRGLPASTSTARPWTGTPAGSLCPFWTVRGCSRCAAPRTSLRRRWECPARPATHC